jgi:uncharacterized membrane protein
MRRTVIISTLLIIAQFLVALYLFPIMPARMAIHWNLHGDADGYGSRIMGLFIFPAIETVLLPIFLVLPKIDPTGDFDKSNVIYGWFILGFVGFMGYMFGLTVGWNLGYRFDFMRVLVPALGALFYGLGILMSRVGMNWFIGIRTPWTLSSKEVWDDTHRLGGRLFKVSGLLAFSGILFGGWLSLALALIPITLSGMYVVYYSYQKYTQIKNK